MSAGFLVLENTGAEADALIGASCDCAQSVELHVMAETDGKMTMRQVQRFDLPAGGRFELKSGGPHLMLIGLTAPLDPAKPVQLKLRFERAPEQTMDVPVRDPRAPADLDVCASTRRNVGRIFGGHCLRRRAGDGSRPLADRRRHRAHPGRRRGISSLRPWRGGEARLLGYASCPDVCPRALSRVSQVEKLLGPLAEQLLAVFVSVDPERDTPDHLAEWLGFFAVRGVGVTGSAERVATVAKAYGAFYEKRPSGSAMGYLIDHSTYLYLVDRAGRVRHLVRSEDSPESIAGWVRALLAEPG